MKYFPYRELTYKIIGLLYKIRKDYGSAQKELVYQNALAEMLEKANLSYKREVDVPIYSQETGKRLGNYRIDFIIENKIIIEVKAMKFTPPKIAQQVFSYLKHTSYEVGYLVNFGSPRFYLKRYILTNDRKPSVASVKKSVASVSLGFTLLELLIVVALLALIAVAAFVLLNPLKQIQKGWDGKRKTELGQLRKVLEDWYNDKNCYPQPGQICYDDPQTTPGGTYYICHICGKDADSPNFSPYLPSLPCDPQHSTKKYLYQVENAPCPSWYKIYTTLNNTSDPVIAEVGCSGGCGVGDYTGFIYQYGVTSPNTSLEKGPGEYYCNQPGNCSQVPAGYICTPSFSSPSCDGGPNRCQTVGTCVPK